MESQHEAIDLTVCEQEAIRIPGSVQPHGFLAAVREEDMAIVQVSDNTASFTGLAASALLGQPATVLIGAAPCLRLRDVLREEGNIAKPIHFDAVTLPGGGVMNLLVHQADGLLMLEFEPTASTLPGRSRHLASLISDFLSHLTDTDSVEAMSALAAREIKTLTGFGRVLVYRFDHEGHGHVIAEARNPAYHSYLHQRFPASDVPRQARDLYLANRVRLIPDAGYEPASLLPPRNPVTGEPTDLSFATLRSVSPVHKRYMQNMGTLASMSVSLVVQGKLWGLISCHNAEPAFVDFDARAVCEQLGQILALRIESREERDEYTYRLELRRILVSMLSALSQSTDFVTNMASVSHELLRFANASGAAICFEGKLSCFGLTPDAPQILDLVEWLSARSHNDLFHTDDLSGAYAPASEFKDCASGIMALPISQIHRHYLVWFRPEVIRTIDWAGNPHLKENVGDGIAAALTPRSSFATWRETVHGRSLPWRKSEIETALEFRTALLGIVLERAEQMAELAEGLGRANKELESFSYSVSHDLRAPLRHIAGFTDLLMEFEGSQLSERGLRFLRNIKDSARFAGKLVDDLLSFSQMGRAALRIDKVDMNELVTNALTKIANDDEGRVVNWKIASLPMIEGDPAFLQLALYNLLANAVKYTRTREVAEIEVSSESTNDEIIFHVRDNGVGFSMEYVHKLFGVFQRLHRMEDFEGTGIGLANVRRIVERHGGRVWAEGRPDEGAMFSFSIPVHLSVPEQSSTTHVKANSSR
ncbi:Bacteriophytochrome (light-regulated signal transduction histidine kinase) [Noviherbaspirillum humi]|uniref:histidine kinase n=1 Tax=Noviherbaspirillum humi TaxID=1688639 RepID=A0A239HDT6_9BURK|nr:ATP-binding protein [Noviherbaspirillum humi]SNS79452.1 Bacteriophytochrome (light-regulated signal transduction histidine kinase) [Noviherbaspirillum humi]